MLRLTGPERIGGKDEKEENPKCLENFVICT